MAETMNFGPEWLRALADGSQSTGSVPATGSKFKLAEYRYGREEMLTLFLETCEPPSQLKKFPHIYVQETQTPISLTSLSEDEQRLIAQGVNSQAVMRPSRGAQGAARGGRGGMMVDRGRARGRGRGDVYTRGGLENGDIGGGFGRTRGPNKDGWEEVGNRKLERGFTRPFDEVGREGHPRFSRSMSDNWRDKGAVDEDDEGDWRKPVSRERWSARTSWREPGRGGPDMDRREAPFSRSRGFDVEDRGRRIGEPRDSEDFQRSSKLWRTLEQLKWLFQGLENVPEWVDDRSGDVGTFDSTGAFVSNREPPHLHKEEKGDPLPGSGDPSQMNHVRQRGGLQPADQENDWESSDSSQEVSADTGGPGVQGSREGAGSAVELDNEAPHEGLPLATRAGVLPADVSPRTSDEEEELVKIEVPVVPMSHENGLKWYYVDPQGNLQGPFVPEDMAQWFSAGYFTMCLKVRRGCDHDFQPLGDLMKQWGHVPFLPGPVHPPIVKLPTQPVTGSPPEPAATTTTTPTTTHPAVSPSGPSPDSAASFNLSQVAGRSDNVAVLQQQLMIQHQVLTLQMDIRRIQMQTLSQLQEQENFKALDPAQQQQVSMQIMQANPLLQQCMQQVQQLQAMQQQTQQLQAVQQQTQQTQQQLQLLSQGSDLPAVPSVAGSMSIPPSLQHSQPLPSAMDIRPSSSPTFPLPVTQPASEEEGQGQGDIPSIWGSGPSAGGWSLAQPTSVWELEGSLSAPAVKPDLDKMRKEKEEYERLIEAERKQQEEIHKQQEELRRQAEALQREREQMEREKEELERQRILEMQRVEEMRRQQEEEQRRREREQAERRKQEEEEAWRKQLEEQKRREEEEAQRRREEEERRKQEERLRGEERRKKQQEEEEWRKQEELRQKRELEELALQEMKRLEEVRQQQEAMRQRQQEKQQEAEAAQKKKDLERQQQEALKRMQQQQALQNIQLPSSVNWARQQQGTQSVQSRSLAEIQQEEEYRQLQQERERQQQLQRQQEEQQQQLQQQQQPQKTWANSIASQHPARVKTLAEIQEEQEGQLRQEKEKAQQQQQYQAKTLSLSQAAAWGSGPGLSSSTAPTSSNTAWSGTNSIWGAPSSATSSSSPLWGNSVPAQKSAGKKGGKDSSSSMQAASEFPSLHKSNKSKQTTAKSATGSTTITTTAGKSKKEEQEAVQRLFKDKSKDEFTMWCEAFLGDMDVDVDIETFVSFLQAVDSPYEIHDYVKNYIGETQKAQEFGKQFLERRSHYNNKARKEKRQEEESIWGPAPAVNPREIRGNTVQTSNNDHGFTEVVGKSKGGKKKKKMQKLDGSALLGFTVAKDPNRKNAGEIESID